MPPSRPVVGYAARCRQLATTYVRPVASRWHEVWPIVLGILIGSMVGTGVCVVIYTVWLRWLF